MNKQHTISVNQTIFSKTIQITLLIVRVHQISYCTTCIIVLLFLGIFCCSDDGVDDLDKYRQSYVDILIRQKDYGKFEKAIIKAARGNYRRKMEIYLNIIDEYKINMLSSFPAANTFLKTAVLFCHYGESIAV